jgi:2',3'-cyclic-nucleotide 2'-phosphodiesterase/3'-nucleotidase
MVWDRDNLRGRMVIRDIVPEVRRAADEARARGAQLVIVTVHSGLDEPSSYDTATTHQPDENVAARIAHDVPGIALIVYGHSHRQMADTVINGTVLVQPKNWAASVAVARLTVERTGGSWQVAGHHGVLVRTAGHREDSSVVRAVASAHNATLAYVCTGTTCDAPVSSLPALVRRLRDGVKLKSR